MTEWPTVRLSDLCIDITVGHVGKMSDQYIPSGIPFLRSQDIEPGRIAVGNIKFIDGKFQRQLRKSRLIPGDVIMVRTGYPGTAAVVPESLPDANCADLVIARPGPRLDPYFLAYTMNSPWGRGRVRGSLVGVAQQHFNVGVAARLEIPLPPLGIQRRIASILGAYDDLIEVNRRRIAVLEEMARRLFDEWFVHFRFPGHEGHKMVETEHGMLPEGWVRGPINRAYDGLFDGPHATPAPSDDGPVFLGIGNITETGRLDLSFIRHIAESDFERWTKRVEPREGDIVFTYEATLNRYALIPKGFRGCLGRRLALIRANVSSGHAIFLYLMFFTAAWREIVSANTLSGATVDRIPLTRFPNFPITLPPDGILSQFNRVVRPIFDQMHTLETATANLKVQRDLLLPRLISGDLSVTAAERELEAA